MKKHRRSVIMKEESYIRNVKYFLEEVVESSKKKIRRFNLPKMQKQDFMITIQMKSITAC